MKVFLSSTAQDLIAYRQMADDTLLRLSQEAVVMERFGPLPGEPAAECERKAAECDVTVCLVAHRYGYVPDLGRGSITRREVEAARSAGKDVLVWIVADDYPWTEKKEQDLLTDPAVLADRTRIDEVAANVQALLDFKAWLRKTFTFETFTTPDDLGRKIAVRLGTYTDRHARPAATSQVRTEVRIVHALQPAPHFVGREPLVADLTTWVHDLASPDRVWALVAAGGTGKTAVVEQVVARMRPGDGSVLVWSFYERPDADAFLRECNQLFLGEDEGQPGGRLERLERGLRDGRPHLIVLDGLERVQEDAGGGRVRGELSDHSLRLLLRSISAGLGRTRALVTSRYPLVDLEDWTNRGYRGTDLDDLSPEAAIAVLRGWGVSGEDADLAAAVEQVGRHALSVAVIGSYLQSFAGGEIEAVADFALDAISADDAKAAKLARVLGFYAQRLPAEERDLLTRLAVFPRGVTLDLLGTLVDAGGEVAGVLVNARPRLVALLASLHKRGLVFQYRSGATVTWTAHPFLRDRFRQLLACPPERVFAVVADALGAGLESRPDANPSDLDELDRYERLIEATRLAGRETDAFELYFRGLGSYRHLAKKLGEFERGYRIIAGFSRTGRLEDIAPSLSPFMRSLLASDFGLLAAKLGRLEEASIANRLEDEWTKTLADPSEMSIALRNSSEVALAQGRLPEARALASASVAEAEEASDPYLQQASLGFRAMTAHVLGDTPAARRDFAAMLEFRGEPIVSLRCLMYARHRLDLGDVLGARTLADHGLEVARNQDWNYEIPAFHALLARIAFADDSDATPHISLIREWTSRTGDMERIVEAHLLAAQDQLARGDFQAALAEAESGLLHAASCGYRLLRVELLIVLARIWLVWPDPANAIAAAREALDVASHTTCGYAWGEADAAQAWGEGYFSHLELPLARRALDRALEIRRRIEHPGVTETEEWLARADGVRAAAAP